jgi:ABC-type polysaccharide/polyol phosphate transport system ATPase subunit
VGVVAIRAEGLGKSYRLGERVPYRTLYDSLARAAAAPLAAWRGRRAPAGGRARPELLWALRDVSFDVRHGEVVGIVGRNGAGKSTLLKILSRITEPTTGRAEIHGRVGSLLEVGTGFHPELTGRENVYLNGAILGMRRREIERRFDEIVAFAEVERFIDTPIKHYSSGMHLRLAFAVAAHLEAEILLVDEVLAVGDVQFQRRCLGKMDEVARGGRTVLFVSHQMTQIRRLCERCLWLDGGQVREAGATAKVVSAYLAAMTAPEGGRAARPDGVPARFLHWDLVGPAGEGGHALDRRGPVAVRFTLRVDAPLRRMSHGVALLRGDGLNLWATAVTGLDLAPGVHEVVHRLPDLPVQPGVYYWQVSLYDDGGVLDLWDCVPELLVTVPPVTHYRDEYTGVLNVASACAVDGREVAGP